MVAANVCTEAASVVPGGSVPQDWGSDWKGSLSRLSVCLGYVELVLSGSAACHVGHCCQVHNMLWIEVVYLFVGRHRRGECDCLLDTEPF